MIVSIDILKTILNGFLIKIKNNFIPKSEVEEIKAINIATEMGLVSPTTADDGSIYTDENGILYTL